MFAPISSSLRYTLPRAELYGLDRQSGAYPTKARTGDSTRTGRNKVYFDDARSVRFQTSSLVNLPTTFPLGSSHLVQDLSSSLSCLGNVRADGIEQWIAHREQIERPGPFVESKLFEQDEHAVLNSSFMTGAANNIAPDRFKSGVSSKTIIRITIPLVQSTTLSTNSSSMYYLNASTGRLDLISQNRRNDFRGYGTGRENPAGVGMFDPILFGPFGYLNCPNQYSPSNAYNANITKPSIAMGQINTFVPDGFTFFDAGSLFSLGVFSRSDLATGSLINAAHSASADQSIDLSAYLSHPFLLEKAVVELPFAAGPGWMNDAYTMASFITQVAVDPNGVGAKIVDAGGPMITVGLLRQDGAGLRHRDLIASATFTNACDALTASYLLCSHSVNDNTNSGIVAAQILYTRAGLSGTVDPTYVCRGPVISGSNNFFTSAIRLPMTPAVTHHITRVRLSGTSEIGFYNAGRLTGSSPLGSQLQGARPYMANLMTFGSPTRRPGLFESGRSILGNNLTTLSTKLEGSDVPISGYETDFESLTGKKRDTNKTQAGKVYWDVKSSTKPSPYLLLPNDKLVVCVNKHRACATTMSISLTNALSTMQVRALHDAVIRTGSMIITLYGDLVREDKEFHDTLNQRLETPELWENVGDEPVLDQFDVAYAKELSGSYVDRFNVEGALNYRDFGNVNKLTSSIETRQYYSNYSPSNLNAVVSTKYGWSSTLKIDELRKNMRGVVHNTLNEVFWDTRVPDPYDVVKSPGATVTLYPGDLSYRAGLTIAGTSWAMAYPYENKFSNASYLFSNECVGHIFLVGRPSSMGLDLRFLYYGEINLILGELGDIGGEDQFAGMGMIEFIKAFYGIGNGYAKFDNQCVTFRQFQGYSSTTSVGVDLRGWRYGLLNAFSQKSIAVFRRNRFGQFRDMLEQRLDAKFHDGTSAKDSPVQVEFYDRSGNLTDSVMTLSSNLSTEATSSVPYTDGIARNRSTIDYGNLNISNVVF